MISGPTYSIGLQWDGAHWEISIKELDLCAVAIHAKTFDDAAVVADHMIAVALLPVGRERSHAPRKQAASAA
jgi:hypothetical protein